MIISVMSGGPSCSRATRGDLEFYSREHSWALACTVSIHRIGGYMQLFPFT
jgi:hypothetical protein